MYFFLLLSGLKNRFEIDYWMMKHLANFFFFQGPSASAYVTYIRSEDALRAIQCVNNVVVDGRTLKVTS